MINIIPINDLQPHIENDMCNCKPIVKIKNGIFIIIHNSYDRREFKEQLINNIGLN
jgi:hypothetical protein